MLTGQATELLAWFKVANVKVAEKYDSATG